jgi:hypothetical protein
MSVIVGGVAETISSFFEESESISKASKSKLTLYDMDDFLSKLSTLTKADDQTVVLTSISKKCTVNDLKMTIRLIKGDLRMNAGIVFSLQNKIFLANKIYAIIYILPILGVLFNYLN